MEKTDANEDIYEVESKYRAIDMYCWMYSTFKIPKDYKGHCAGIDQADHENQPLYNAYYQWVPIYLACLAFLFLVPWLLWKSLEGM